MKTTTETTVDIYRLAHHLRVARDGYALSAKALRDEGYKEDHEFVQMFFDLINECTEIALAINMCDHITIGTDPVTNNPSIVIHQ